MKYILKHPMTKIIVHYKHNSNIKITNNSNNKNRWAWHVTSIPDNWKKVGGGRFKNIQKTVNKIQWK